MAAVEVEGPRRARAGSIGFYQVAFTFGELPGQRMLAEAATLRMLGFADAEPRPQARTSLFATLGTKGLRR